ncbi:MAG: ATP-binding protein [Myxococcales bacterium]|nr:ATP-binding protein [Myxococcales bacterium]
MVGPHTLHIVCGPAGAGKTTYGERLAAQLKAALVDIDVATERLARLVLRANGLPETDRDSPAFKALLRQPVYDTLFDIARHNLPHTSCVVVGPFTRECRLPGWPAQLEASCGAPVDVHFVTCSDPVRKARIEARGNPRDAEKLAHWDEYVVASHIPPPAFPHRLVLTDET